MDIYGKKIDLQPLGPEGGIVTDVMVLARVVRYGAGPRAEDVILVSSTDSTTGVIAQGVLNDAMLQIGAGHSG
jgi:hypothetical protein